MKTLFDIGDKKKETAITLLELGNHYCCIAGFDTVENKVAWLTYKTYEHFDSETIQSLVNEVGDDNKVIISAVVPEFFLTPLSYNCEGALYQLFPNQKSVALSDTINEWQVKNQYLVPSAVYEVMQTKFASISYVHYFTPALKNHHGISAENQIAIQFAPEQFSVLVKKGGQLQLAQIYHYKGPLDVVYYLLKITEELKMSAEETVLVISGLIEVQSDLYKELYQYFEHIKLAAPSAAIIDDDKHPSHFFTSLYNLAACVS